MKIIKVERCDECPYYGKCTAWVGLSALQRVYTRLGSGPGPFILKGCNLEDMPQVTEAKKPAHVMVGMVQPGEE